MRILLIELANELLFVNRTHPLSQLRYPFEFSFTRVQEDLRCKSNVNLFFLAIFVDPCIFYHNDIIFLRIYRLSSVTPESNFNFTAGLIVDSNISSSFAVGVFQLH